LGRDSRLLHLPHLPPGLCAQKIAQKYGDWHILLFVLLANYGLFWLASTHR
jgi:hypothetical protein